MQKRIKIELKPGYRTALIDGTLVPESPMHMATEELYHAVVGSRLHLCDAGYVFAPAIYSLERNKEYIYTYAYSPEQNWTTYTKNLTPQGYRSEDYIFEQECYFRVCVRRNDGQVLTREDKEKAFMIMEYYHEETIYKTKPWFEEEIEKTVTDIHRHENEGALKICLLTDTHYTVNGIWEDTAENIRRVSEQADYDAMIHLGDLTDGMVSKELTKKYVHKIITDLGKCNVPFYITLGNHDTNYFRNSANMFSKEEMQQIYHLPGEELDYYVDLPQYAVRMIFVSSFDDRERIRYGYTKEQLLWLKRTLYDAPEGTQFLIFSHDAPLAKLDYWSYWIRNGAEFLDILEACNGEEHYQIAGLFYGHVHADSYFDECSFPVISIGCAKLEEFYDKKPENTITWKRKADDVSQDLWDSLIVDFEHQKLNMIRFGAGEDREYSFAKKESRYQDVLVQEKKNRKVKIWAHRGASGHAPENTMPAFELADMLGADGIELDVQLTKDGIPVVIHDETIDRVCDGKGRVKDFSLKELKCFNANKYFPAYGKVRIPTLEEVFDYIKTTDMMMNLELKNSVIFYEQLEEKVLQLAAEKGLEDRIIYSSFNHYSMKRIKELNPNAKTAFLYADGIIDIAEYAERYGMDAVHPYIRNTGYPGMIEECHKKGIRVNVWTVNEATDIKAMKELGVDAIITNYVERG